MLNPRINHHLTEEASTETTNHDYAKPTGTTKIAALKIAHELPEKIPS
jgi:hypothetical protein